MTRTEARAEIKRLYPRLASSPSALGSTLTSDTLRRLAAAYRAVSETSTCPNHTLERPS